MGIKMNTYAGGQMTAGNDAILHDRAIANTGILHGCNITFMGANQVHIEKGYLLIKGRYCTVTEDTIQVAMSNSETELPGRLYVRADLADAQEPVKILSVAADPLPKLTQDENFNYDNGVWEVELATYTAGMTAIKDLTVTCEEVPEGASKKETAALLGKIDELTEKTKEVYKSEAAFAVSQTVHMSCIENDSENSVYLISSYRYAFAGSMVLTRKDIVEGNWGEAFTILAQNPEHYWVFKLTSDFELTLVTNHECGLPYVSVTRL